MCFHIPKERQLILLFEKLILTDLIVKCHNNISFSNKFEILVTRLVRLILSYIMFSLILYNIADPYSIATSNTRMKKISRFYPNEKNLQIFWRGISPIKMSVRSSVCHQPHFQVLWKTSKKLNILYFWWDIRIIADKFSPEHTWASQFTKRSSGWAKKLQLTVNNWISGYFEVTFQIWTT